eukprot:Em0003g1174a
MVPSQDQVPSQENSRPKTRVPVISAVPRHGPVPRQEFPSQDIVPSQGSRRKGMLPSQDMVPSQDRNSRPVPKRNNNEGAEVKNMPSKSELIEASLTTAGCYEGSSLVYASGKLALLEKM